MDITTIRIQKELVRELRKHEVHPRETNEDIIKRLLKIKGELNTSEEVDASNSKKEKEK